MSDALEKSIGSDWPREVQFSSNTMQKRGNSLQKRCNSMKIRVRKQAFLLFDLRNSGSQSSPLSSCILKIKALTMNQ